MRVLVFVLGIGLTLAACGGSGGVRTTSGTLPAPPTTDETEATASSSSVPTTIGSSAAPETTEPGRAPAGDAEAEFPLSIEDALLPDDAFPAPWELQWRETDQAGYGSGPNQTDCAPYWAFEELRGAGGGHVMWWVDGGNANHYVTRVDADDVGSMYALASIADECPRVRWTEGGSFRTERIALPASPEAVGLKLTDSASGETTWVAVIRRGDLISILDIPLWTDIDGDLVDFGAEDLNRLAAQMEVALQVAQRRSEQSPTKVPTTTTLAPPTPVPATGPPTTLPQPATTVAPPITGLGKLLLDGTDLPTGFTAPSVRAHRPDGPDAELATVCPPAASIDRIDDMLEWSAEFDGPGVVAIDQNIGRAATAAEAGEVVELFAEMSDCDLSSSFGPTDDTSGGSIVISGADAAASLVVVAADEEFVGEVIVASVGDVLVVISAGSAADPESAGRRAELDLDLADALARLAVAKVRTAGT